MAAKLHRQNIFGQEHNLSISGGSEKVKYYISGAFLSQEGQMNYSDEKKKRYNISGKVNGQVTKWLNLDFNARFIREDISMPTFMKLYGDRFFLKRLNCIPQCRYMITMDIILVTLN